MAKSTTPRHSKTTRKPVTIDLDPSAVNAMPDAEPVGSGPDAEPVGSGLDAELVGNFEPQVKSSEAPQSIASEKTMNSAPSDASSANKTTSPWLAGLAGGVIVLLGTTALQMSGVMPFSTPTKDAGLTEQVAMLEQQLSALQSVPAPKPDAELLVRLDAAENTISQMQKLITELPQISDMQANSDNTALREELNQRLNDVEAKLNTASTQAEQASAALSTDAQTVQDLQKQFSALQTKVAQQASQPDMAAIIAVNALKSVIDRGGSYSNELQTTLSVLPKQSDVVAGLEALAPTGVPTLSQLNTQFATLADQIVAVENKPAADAGIWDHLMTSAKGLIRSRPIGEVEGTGVGPVTARIEVALQKGDVERAISEWAQLPEAAKQVGQSFYNALAARRDADALIARLIAETTKPAAQ